MQTILEVWNRKCGAQLGCHLRHNRYGSGCLTQQVLGWTPPDSLQQRLPIRLGPFLLCFETNIMLVQTFNIFTVNHTIHEVSLLLSVLEFNNFILPLRVTRIAHPFDSIHSHLSHMSNQLKKIATLHHSLFLNCSFCVFHLYFFYSAKPDLISHTP